MSVRARGSVSARPPPPKSKPPPPPSFAPPPLPETPSLNVYKRKERLSSEIEEQEAVLPPKFKIEELTISEMVQTPKLRAESAVTETVNITLNRRRVSRESQQDNGLAKGDTEGDADLVPEIRNKCNDVNEILNRILQSDEEFEMESINEHEDEHPVEPVTDNHKKDDPFVNIDNIADLTLDEVREILEKEEETNAKLKEDLVSSKEDKLEKYKSEKENNPDVSRVRSEKQKPRKRKKEQQLEKLKNFLKDPDGAEDQEVELDIRLRKSGKSELL